MNVIRKKCVVMLACIALGSCASLDERECLAGDWYSIGVRDGAKGRSEEYLLEHSKACAEYDVKPDRNAWLEGRDEGLARFCTAENGVRVGESGGSYSGVCYAAGDDEFLRGYTVGQQLYATTAKLDEIETNIRTTENALRQTELSEQDRERLQQRLREYEYQRGYIRREYDELSRRARGI